jgi:putative restriction endonuclease
VEPRRERAPHKPLLLLLTLGRLRREGDRGLVFAEIEAELGWLLREFGPARETSAAYPFHHLVTDGLWTVTTREGAGSPGAAVGAPRASGATGRLAPDFAAALVEEPQLLPRVVRILLEGNFPASLHAEICAAVGLDALGSDVESAGFSPDADSPVERLTRSAEFRREVLLAYEYRCSFCSYDGLIRQTAVGLDAAHVRWWAFEGPDVVANGLALCSLHHKLFDKGVLGIDAERRVTVSAHFVGRSDAARGLVSDLVGRPVLGPQAGFDGVGAEFAG